MMADIPDLDPEQVESMVTMHRGMFWSILKGVAIVGAWTTYGFAGGPRQRMLRPGGRVTDGNTW